MPDAKVAAYDLVLVGFGHVGRRFGRLLGEQRDRLAREHRLACRVIGIATRNHGAAINRRGLDLDRAIDAVEHGRSLAALHAAHEGRAPADGRALLEQLGRCREAPPRVVVETTVLDVETGQPAIDHVRAAIDAGAHVVTANKGPAAFAYRQLRDRAEGAGVMFLTEGAVLDGIPVLNLVRETLPTVRIDGFRGIVNSTTNHVLTALENGASAVEALAAMQAQGIAEADASLDTDGWDAAAKTAVLINVLMDGRATPQTIARTGIADVSTEEARAARRRGRRIKLVASAERRGNVVRGSVAPTELAADDPLAGLDGQANAVVFRTDLLGEIMITELDGGLTQTAFALLADLVTIRRAARTAAATL